jgi:hypothetical protein
MQNLTSKPGLHADPLHVGSATSTTIAGYDPLGPVMQK